jgi:hypothetical protein
MVEVDTDAELVPVYVPRALVAEVYAAITDYLRSGQEPDSTLRRMTPSQPIYAAKWEEAVIRRAYEESGPPMRRVLKTLAARAGEDVGSDELAAAIGEGATSANLAGVMGAFGRRVRSRYRQSRPFFASRWDADRDRTVYWMPREAAEVISAAQR